MAGLGAHFMQGMLTFSTSPVIGTHHTSLQQLLSAALTMHLLQVVCLFGLAWSRAANVLPCCAAINYVRPPDLGISKKQQLVLWWSGLRGAMAFALSVEAMRSFPGETGKVIMTCTFMVILITVLVNGGSTGYLLAWCNLVEGKCTAGDTIVNGGSKDVDDPEKAQLLLSTGDSGSTGDLQVDWKVAVLDRSNTADSQLKGDGLVQGSAAERSDSVEELQTLLQERLQQQLQQRQAAMLDTTSSRSACTRDMAAVAAASETGGGLPAAATGMELASQGLGLSGGSSNKSSAGGDGHQYNDSARNESCDTMLVATSRIQNRPSLLEMLRNNNSSLQDSLDSWGARYLQPWFVNAQSAAVHLPQQQQQHVQQQGMSASQSQQASNQISVQMHCRATGTSN